MIAKIQNFSLIFLIAFTGPLLAQADYLPDQDTEIIGKKLWVYYNLSECRDNFRIYPSKSTSNVLQINEAVEVEVKELNKTPLNWYSGAWYDVAIGDGSTIVRGYVTYSDMNSSMGYTKNLYYANMNDIDPILLKSACIANFSPKERLAVFEKETAKLKELEARQSVEEAKRHQVEAERRKAEAAAEAEALRIKKQNDDIRVAKIVKERRAEDLKNAPEFLKELTDDYFCENYGDFLRGEYLTGFGTAEDMMPIITKEAKRRKLKFNNAKLIKEKNIKLGISTCEMYASLGRPVSENRTVGSFGVHTQHVYGSRAYVYSENGVVTSWQD